MRARIPSWALRPAALISPRHRRWRRLLAGLTLDPDRLPRPLEAPGSRDFVICGCPRSGTTLMAAVLFQPPHAVTVSEPWDGLRLPPAELFRSFRTEIAETGALARGRLDVAELARGRVTWSRDGTVRTDLEVDPDYVLGVKWPAFWRYLDLLPETRFVVCVRDPAEVTTSFVEHGGALAEGLDYPVAFNERMNRHLRDATSDLATRRLLLYEYINSRIVPHLTRPNVFVARYERWSTEPDTLIDELSRFLEVPLTRGPVVIRAPRRGRTADPDDASSIRRHCPSAALLGYPQGPPATRSAPALEA